MSLEELAGQLNAWCEEVECPFVPLLQCERCGAWVFHVLALDEMEDYPMPEDLRLRVSSALRDVPTSQPLFEAFSLFEALCRTCAEVESAQVEDSQQVRPDCVAEPDGTV